jgi:DNA polymerase elongation subunit (family B)
MVMENKKRKLSICAKYRLFDCNFYDHTPRNEGSDDEQPRNAGTSHFMIELYGINEEGKTCCIKVNDYKPFFYVKVGDNWDNSYVGSFKSYIMKKMGYASKYLLSVELVSKKKLYGFTHGKESKFVKLKFVNNTGMNKAKGLWYTYNETERIRVNLVYNINNKHYKLELYESNIPPLLRYYHINELSPSGWVKIKNTQRHEVSNNKTTTCDAEYECGERHVVPMPECEKRVPYKICSFDIEASSSHGDFPLPIKTYKRLASNIMELFDKHKPNPSMSKTLIKSSILTAFGYQNFEGVDLVYPKEKGATKSDIEKLIKKIIDAKLNDVILEAQNCDNNQTLDYMFSNQNEMSGGYNSDDENPYYKKKNKKIDRSVSVTDVLLNDDYAREDKINDFDKLMTRILPPLQGDKVTFIGSTFMNYGDAKPYLNHCLVLGTCDDVADATIDTVTTEAQLLVAWTKLIDEENPDIIIGYNIFGFDYQFMFHRAQENNCEEEFLKLSRKKGEVCGVRDNDRSSKNVGRIKNIEHSKVVLASGEYDLNYTKTTGRLQIDMYTYFRRDFNLSSYKLDDVAGEYIGDDIKKVVDIQGNMTELYSKNLTGLNKDDFIHIELLTFTKDYYGGGKKFRALDIKRDVEVIEIVKGKEQTNKYNIIVIEGHHEETIDMTKSVRWGMAKDDVSPQDIFRLTNGSSSDRAIVAKYCIQDCNLVHHLMNKIDVITGYNEMSRMCSVPISFLVFRGQGIKLTSYVAKKCRIKNTLMPDIEKSFGKEGYEGAIVLPPKCDFYLDNPVACVDYSSLYPSSIISENLSHDSKVWTKEYDLNGDELINRGTGEKDKHGNYIYDNLPGYKYVNIKYDTFRYIRPQNRPQAAEVKTLMGYKICRFAQFPEGKAILPSILEELLHERKATRKMIPLQTDEFMKNVLDKRQLSIKVTANSLYGQTGAKTSTFYEPDVAASTTATGRKLLIYGKHIIEECYGDTICDTEEGIVRSKAEYVYGDTDSVFFTFNLETLEGEKIVGKQALKITIELAKRAGELATQFLKAPHDLEYEKTFWPFCLLSKKRYVGILYEHNPDKGKLKYMGLSLKRRDACDYLKDTYGGIVNILMKENTISNAIDFLDKSLNNLIEGNVSMDKLAITRALRSGYKNPNQIAHKVLANRIAEREPGNKPKPGDRIKYLFINTDSKKKLMGERIETPEFITNNDIEIDYAHYITNQLMKPLQQLFGLAVEKIWEHQRKPNAIKKYRKDIENLELEHGDDYELYMKKKEKYCSLKVKTLLFDKVLNKIANKRNGIQTITNFYTFAK